jgi:hypothetical protein
MPKSNIQCDGNAKIVSTSKSLTFRESKGYEFRNVFPAAKIGRPRCHRQKLYTFTKLGPAVAGPALISSPMRCHSVGCGTLSRATQ